MKLLELVHYFRNDGNLDEFFVKNNLNSDSEVVEIFMKERLEIDSTLAFFEIEKTEGKILFRKDGNNYHNLFDFYFFLDFIDEFKMKEENYTDEQIAIRLIMYAINDA